ncbi:MAG: hypothetical protein ACI9FU_000947 [Granulosicoccus sp.]|jgi:hypothetical protein
MGYYMNVVTYILLAISLISVVVLEIMIYSQKKSGSS